jgi:RNA polymerase sigma-70 factor (ECF subfamily)
VRARAERLHRIAWRLVGGDDAAARDGVQDALVRAFRGLRRFRGDGSLEAWLVRILVHAARSHRRWAALRLRHLAPADVDSAPANAPPPDVLLRRQLRAAVRTLSATQREVFVLVHLEGHTVSETATLLGRAEGTVKSHLHRALAKLRAALGPVREERNRP